MRRETFNLLSVLQKSNSISIVVGNLSEECQTTFAGKEVKKGEHRWPSLQAEGPTGVNHSLVTRGSRRRRYRRCSLVPNNIKMATLK